MGYTTDFDGNFKFNKPLDKGTLDILTGLATTRRMRRDMTKLFPNNAEKAARFGIEGEFYIPKYDEDGHTHDSSVIDHNMPPKTQPSLRCQWAPNEDGTELAWDGGEKFYNYIEWLEYIVERILKPRGYSITGLVIWRGEEVDDIGTIIVKNNKIDVREGKHIKFAKNKKGAL